MTKLIKVGRGRMTSFILADLIPLISKRNTLLGDYKIDFSWLSFYITLYFIRNKK